ncbi:uncharacterized protein L199_008191 [Kwoniella botswanensis]|uniref:uncharacterized protein n=1 Tax=Kwoniella botswanensis TaxID=1268659 RepID=UPI00315D2C15
MIEPSSSSSQVKMKSPEAIFTTLRYTSSSSSANLPVKKESLPLLDLHFERLREAFDHFSERDGKDRWGDWPSEERIWEELKEVLEQSRPGDYRVRIVIHPGSEIEVHCVPAPKDAGPFTLLPSLTRQNNRRPVILDPQDTSINSDPTEETDLRLYKTVNREIYDEAYERGQTNTTDTSHNEVLLHTSTEILETTTSNTAILLPNSHSPKWITPVLSKDTPFLNGVMRRYLLFQGVIEEGQVTIDMLNEVREAGKGGRIIGFNGLRGVWEGELM